VRHGQGFAAVGEAGAELEHAAGVGGDQQIRACGQDVLGLALAELGGGLWLEQVVDPGGASSRPGTVARVCRGWARTPWAWPRWQASW
jgi:hypothetical protein